MKDAQLQRMSINELIGLKERIDSVLSSKKQDERRVVRDKLEELARKHGFKASDLFNGAGKGGKAIPKYRNPNNAKETWTGRGRKPRWLVTAGGDTKRFLIK